MKTIFAGLLSALVSISALAADTADHDHQGDVNSRVYSFNVPSFAQTVSGYATFATVGEGSDACATTVFVPSADIVPTQNAGRTWSVIRTDSSGNYLSTVSSRHPTMTFKGGVAYTINHVGGDIAPGDRLVWVSNATGTGIVDAGGTITVTHVPCP